MGDKNSVIIAISGISGAGKTRTVQALQKLLDNSTILLYDDYNPNYDNFLEEILLVKRKNEFSFLIIEDPVGIADSVKDIQPDYKIHIRTPLEVGLARILLRTIKKSSDKGVNEFFESIGPQFHSNYTEEPTKLMHIIVWLLESYLVKHRAQYLKDRERMEHQADLILDGMKSIYENAKEIRDWLNS